MALSVAETLRRLRLVVLSVALSFAAAACGQVGVADGPNSSVNGVSGSVSSPPPVISGTPAASVIAGEAYSFIPATSDPGSNPLTYTIVNKPDWATFDATTGQLSGSPSTASVGTFANIAIAVTDGTASATLPTFSIEVLAPLSIAGNPTTTVTVGASYSFQPTTSLPPGAPLTFAVQNKPAWLNFDPFTGTLSGTPTQPGTYSNILISVSDGTQSSSLPAFAITVSNPTTTNNPPSISGSPPTAVKVGALYSFTPAASDPDGDTLTFSIQNLPVWASFSTATGALKGTPAAANAGTYANIVISVSDGQLSRALPPFSIKVVAPLTISGSPPTQVVAGSSYSFTPTTNATSGTTLTFSVQNRPAWATFSVASGMLSGTPTGSQTGTYSGVVISVTDGVQTISLPAFSITVNAPLTISGTPPTQAVGGTAYSFRPTTNAPSGMSLNFTVQNKPTWASFNTSNGMLTGTPTASQVGTYSNIVISVSNGTQSRSLAPFSIAVIASLQISGNPPAQVTAGSKYSFQPTTNAPNGSALTFAVQNKPVWAGFSTATGALSGTPSSTQVGAYSNIVISVSNGTQSSVLAPFTITVAKSTAAALTISGTPTSSINVGANYGFTPTTTDPSGSPLTFSIQNRPAWASFNATNGALTGTPAAASAGSYPNILISVSDGTASASLSPFSITVNQTSNGSATLNWTPVTLKTDGTLLKDLAGYRVHYGASSSNLNQVVTLSNPSLTTYLVSNLSSGTWYFGITAYASDGTESALSNVGNKTVN